MSLRLKDSPGEEERRSNRELCRMAHCVNYDLLDCGIFGMQKLLRITCSYRTVRTVMVGIIKNTFFGFLAFCHIFYL
jgi:hypothetical protein